MKNILDDVSFKYTLDDDFPIEYNFVTVDHWRKRARVKGNQRWNALRNKVLRNDK